MLYFLPEEDTMTQTLHLQTLYFPQRLLNDLENINKYTLTVLEAPSGFGKTTALDKFFSQKHFYNDSIRVIKHTFFSDNIADYWKKLCELLESIDPLSAQALKEYDMPTPENLSDIRDILHELECAEETYLVLDNLSAAVPELSLLLSALAALSAEKLHMIASVQSVNAKNSFRFSAGNRVHCIGTEEFTFSKEDIRAYFKCVGILLTESELSELMQITEGWIFAVYLQLLFYTKHKRFEKAILNTLIEKAFFSQLNDSERNFYLSLAPFKSFTLDQAVELTGQNVGFAHAALDGCGFIHYDAKKKKFSFHKLIFEYLSEIFEHLEPDTRNALCLSAAAWEEHHGEKIHATRLYYKAGAYEQIFAMPHTSYDLADIGDTGTRQMIFDILDRTPYEVKLRYPQSMVPLAFILFFINEIEKLSEVIEEIALLTENSSLSTEQKNAILGETELLISFTKYNNIAAMSVHHRKAYELLGKKASLIHLRSTWTFGSPSVVCLYHRTAGELDKELQLMDECMPYYYRLTGGHGYGAEYVMRAEADYLRGDFAHAKENAYRAMFESQTRNQISLYQCGLFVLACLSLQSGDENAFFDTSFVMSESAASNTEDMCRYTSELFFGFLYAFIGRLDKVSDWLVKGDITEDKIAPMTMPFAHIIYAKTLLAGKEYIKLLAFSPFACGLSSEFPSVLPQIYFHIFASVAQNALGRLPEAESSLKTALSLALPDRIYTPFAQEFSEIHATLEKLRQAGSLSQADFEAISRFGTEFEKSLAKFGSGKPKLSPREREVADLIRQGLTNKQIAARLYVSISTVKMTISSIFDKTGIKSRAQLFDTTI